MACRKERKKGDYFGAVFGGVLETITTFWHFGKSQILHTQMKQTRVRFNDWSERLDGDWRPSMNIHIVTCACSKTNM